MIRDPLEVLSAFLDGEESDAARLAEALAAPGAREALIDFVRLRALAAEDASVPSDRFYAAIRDHTGLAPPGAGAWRRRLGWGTAAAALLAVGMLAGLAIREGTAPVAGLDNPPPVDREVQFTVGLDWFRY